MILSVDNEEQDEPLAGPLSSQPLGGNGMPAKGVSGLRQMRAPSRRTVGTLFLAWVVMIGFDFLLHAGILARFYVQPSPFLLPAEDAFTPIPLGYAAFLTSAVALVWLAPFLEVRTSGRGLAFGLKLGGLIWGGLALGLASISTAPPSLLAAWFFGQTAEMGVGGMVVGSALSGLPIRALAVRVLAFALLAIVLTIALQSLGFAHAAATR